MTTDRQPRGLTLLIAAAAVTAAGCLAAAAVTAAKHPLPSLLSCLIVVALAFAGASIHLQIRLGAQRLELTWAEAAVILALVVSPPTWVVLLTPLGVGASLARRRVAPIKTIYNISTNTAAAAAAAVIAGDLQQPITAGDAAALAAAGIAVAAITHVAVAAAIAAARGVSLRTTWSAGAGLQVLTVAGNLAAALSVLVLARQDQRLIAVLPLVALCMHQGYLGRLRGHQEREAGKRQSIAVSHLTADLDQPGVVRRAAEEVGALTGADVVDVELTASETEPATLYRHLRRGESWTGSPAQAPALAAHLVAQSPIAGEGGAPAGELRVWLVGGAPDLRLSERDQNAVAILAAATFAALNNARAHAQQTYHATHDRLTGLPARPALLERIESTARTATAGALQPVALVLVDLSGYRDIVRALGHDTAEHLLVRTSEQLRQAAEDGEFLAHVGADDFGIYLDAAQDPTHVRRRALALLEAVAEPYGLEVGTVELDAVAGIAYSPAPVTSGTELLRQAIVALDQARATNLPVEFYDPATDALGGSAAVVMAAELRSALDQGQLDLHYQPIVAIPSGAPVALETLVRWRHPTKGLLYPPEFLAVLEHSRDHGRFVSWQLQEALRTRALWAERDLPVSVNLASRCLLDRSFPKQVAAALERAGVPGDQLMFELSDTSALTGAYPVQSVLERLRLLGVKIAVDRFGTGDSSLPALLDLPATHVKISAEFVQDMTLNERAAAVVRLAVELGRSSDLEVVALGVASDDHVAALTRLGCHLAQGRHLAAPMPASMLRGYLDSAPTAPPPPDADVIELDSRRSLTPRN